MNAKKKRFMDKINKQNYMDSEDIVEYIKISRESPNTEIIPPLTDHKFSYYDDCLGNDLKFLVRAMISLSQRKSNTKHFHVADIHAEWRKLCQNNENIGEKDINLVAKYCRELETYGFFNYRRTSTRGFMYMYNARFDVEEYLEHIDSLGSDWLQ